MTGEQNLIETDLLIDGSISMHLKETSIWGKLLGITGIIYSLLIAVGGIFAASMLGKMTGQSAANPGTGLMAGGSIAIIYLVLAVVMFIMSMYLFKFAQNTQLAIKSNDQETLVSAFKNLKIYFRFAGIITVVALIFTVLGIVGIIIASAFSQGL